MKDCVLKRDDEYGKQRKSERIYAEGDRDNPGHLYLFDMNAYRFKDKVQSTPRIMFSITP